jgi:hypothetical protein
MSAEKERQIVREVIRAWSDQPQCDKLGAHEEEELTDRIIDAAAPALRKQGAEEAAERCRELEEDLREEQRIHGQDAEAARRARSALRSCEKVLATTQAERDQALAKGAEEERERLREELEERVLRVPEPTPKQKALMEEFADEMPVWAQLSFVQSEVERMREEVRKIIVEVGNA